MDNVGDLLRPGGHSEPQHPQRAHGVGHVRPRVPELLHVGPQVGLGAGEAEDPDDLDPGLVNLLVQQRVHVVTRPAGTRLPPETSKPKKVY